MNKYDIVQQGIQSRACLALQGFFCGFSVHFRLDFFDPQTPFSGFFRAPYSVKRGVLRLRIIPALIPPRDLESPRLSYSQFSKLQLSRRRNLRVKRQKRIQLSQWNDLHYLTDIRLRSRTGRLPCTRSESDEIPCDSRCLVEPTTGAESTNKSSTGGSCSGIKVGLSGAAARLAALSNATRPRGLPVALLISRDCDAGLPGNAATVEIEK